MSKTKNSISKKNEIHKTNAARILDKAGIEYELLEYEVDESDLSAVHVANITGEDINIVYKTIVCETISRQYLVACIRGDCELDLKALALASGHKKCELLALKDLEKVTGYVRGGCSPLCMKKRYDTYIDSRALKLDYILISAGIRGKQILVNPQKLAEVINAKFVEIVKK